MGEIKVLSSFKIFTGYVCIGALLFFNDSMIEETSDGRTFLKNKEFWIWFNDIILWDAAENSSEILLPIVEKWSFRALQMVAFSSSISPLTNSYLISLSFGFLLGFILHSVYQTRLSKFPEFSLRFFQFSRVRYPEIITSIWISFI